MNLLAEVKQAATKDRKVSCPVHFVRESLDAEDRADLEAAIADDSIPAATIQGVLTGRGFRLGTGAVATHRRGGCSCSTTGAAYEATPSVPAVSDERTGK